MLIDANWVIMGLLAMFVATIGLAIWEWHHIRRGDYGAHFETEEHAKGCINRPDRTPVSMQPRITREARYYKDQQEYPLMSGLPLPKAENGKVLRVDFLNCRFHPNCGHVEFVDCTFTDCDGMEYIRQSQPN